MKQDTQNGMNHANENLELIAVLVMINNAEMMINADANAKNGVVTTSFLRDEIPKEGTHYTYIACITIDSVMTMEKKNYLQIYLEECKYKIKETKMTNFIKVELQSESESEFKV